MGAMADLNERRLISGFLDHVTDSRLAKRWAVLEKSVDGESVTLRLFQNDKETNEKYSYVLGKDNFIGTERGSVKQFNKRSPALYWAIITVRDQTLLFQDSHNSIKSVSIFEKWDKILKDFWKHQSWLVTPVEGANSFTKESGLTLHINWASVCLATLNPPRHYLRWRLDTLEQVSYENNKLTFTVMKDNNNSGCYEVKTEKERFAPRIKEFIDTLRSRYLGIPPPEQNKLRQNDNQKVMTEGHFYTLHFEKSSLEKAPTSPNLGFHQDRVSPISPIDESTGENIHMEICAVRKLAQESRLCQPNIATSNGDTTPEVTSILKPEVTCIPLIKIVPVSVESEHKQELESHQRQSPHIPPRTTSCAISGTLNSATCWIDSQMDTKLQKGMSSSTSKLHDMNSDHDWVPSWDPSTGTTCTGRALPPVPNSWENKLENSNRCRVTSAVHLPLPKPPVSPSSPTSNEKPSWVKPALLDECECFFDSTSSIASQSSDVTSMDMTQSLSSLSSEEDRCRCSSAESRKKSPIGKSALSLNVYSNSPNDSKNSPGYGRSFSVPTELPQNNLHFTELVEPEYMSTESLGDSHLNLSKKGPVGHSDETHSAEESDANYINLSSKQSLYVNPPLRTHVNPIPLPPRIHVHPTAPPRQSNPGCGTKSCEAMELHEVLDAMLKCDELGGTMGLILSVWIKFCMMCDVERNIYPPKNWKGLAEKLGLKCAEIGMVDDYSRRYNKKPTHIILAYWEKQANPVRPFNKKELVSILHEMERQDLLDIIIQREKHNGVK